MSSKQTQIVIHRFFNSRQSSIAGNLVKLFVLFISAQFAHASLDAGYQALKKGELVESEQLLKPLTNQYQSMCFGETAEHLPCLRFALAAAGLGEVRMRREDLAESYYYFNLAYQGLSLAEQKYISLHNLTPEMPGDQITVPPELEQQFQQTMKDAKAKLEAELKALDIEAELQKNISDSDLPPEAQQMMIQAFKRIAEQQLGNLNSEKIYPITFTDQEYASALASTIDNAKDEVCSSANRFKPKSHEELKQALMTGQLEYINQSKARISINRQVDEANQIIITDILNVNVLNNLKPFIEAGAQAQVERSTQTKPLYQALIRCSDIAHRLIELGVTKAITYGFTDINTLGSIQQLAEMPESKLSHVTAEQLKFHYGWQVFQTSDSTQGLALMESSLLELQADTAPQDITDDTYISRLYPLLKYSSALCKQNAGCTQAVKLKINNHLDTILKHQKQFLDGKASFNTYIRTQMKQSDELDNFLKNVKGSYTIVMGLHAQQRQIYSTRLAELLAAEISLTINNTARAISFLDDGQYAHLPNSIFASTILAKEHSIRAKLAQAENNNNRARDHWRDAIAHYGDTQPLMEIFFGIPPLYRSPTALYEDAAKYFIKQNEFEPAITALELARNHSIAGKKLPEYATPSYMEALRQELISDYKTLVAKGSMGNKQLAQKYKYNPNAPGTQIPGPSDIFYLADNLSFLPGLSEAEAFTYIHKLNNYEGFIHYQNLASILTESSRPSKRSQSNPHTIKELSNTLTDELQIIGTWQSETAFFVYGIEKDNLLAEVYEPSSHSTQALINLTQDFVNRFAKPTRTHLVFMTNAQLSQAPLAKYLQESKALDQNFSISYTSNLDVFFSNTVVENSKPGATVIIPKVENTAYINGDEELKSLQSIMPTETLIYKKATKSHTIKSLENSSVIHLATHAKLNPMNPDFSYIAVNDGNGNIDKIYNYEITQLSLDGAKFVMLNACETSAFSPYILNNEFSSLQHSVLNAGASSVIATIKPVNDDLASAFASAFYREIGNGMSIARAFFNAQQQLREQFPGSDQWAFYTLYSNQSGLNHTFQPN